MWRLHQPPVTRIPATAARSQLLQVPKPLRFLLNLMARTAFTEQGFLYMLYSVRDLPHDTGYKSTV